MTQIPIEDSKVFIFEDRALGGRPHVVNSLRSLLLQHFGSIFILNVTKTKKPSQQRGNLVTLDQRSVNRVFVARFTAHVSATS